MQKLFIGVLILTSSTLCFGQKPGSIQLDTAAAFQNQVMGDSLMQLGQYANAVPYFERSADAYQKEKVYPTYVRLLNKYGDALRKSGKSEDAKKAGELAISINDNYLPDDDASKLYRSISTSLIGIVFFMNADYASTENHFKRALDISLSRSVIDSSEIAASYNNLGIVAMYVGAYDRSLKYHLASVKIRENSENQSPIHLSSAYNNLGQVYEQKNDLDRATQCYAKALNIEKNHLGPNHIKLSSTYNNLGLVYESKGHNNLALQFMDSALQIRKQNLPPDHAEIGQSYDNLGTIYRKIGQGDLGLDYLKKGLEIRIRQFNPKHPILATSYHNVGRSYLQGGNDDEALEHLLKALFIREAALGKIHADVADTYAKVGEVYANMNLRGKALQHQTDALNIRREIVGESHPTIAASYHNIAGSYLKWGSNQQALKYLNLAAATYLKQPGSRRFDLASTYNAIGRVYLDMGLLEDATHYYNLAINSNSINGEKEVLEDLTKLPSVFSKQVLLASITGRAKVLYTKGQSTHNVTDLELATESYNLGVKLIGEIRLSHLRYEDKIGLGVTVSALYNDAVEVYFELYKNSNNEAYLDEAFYLIEKAKSSVLLENISTQSAKRFSGIPEEVLSLENTLKVDISYLQSQVNDLKASNDEQDNPESILTDQLFDLNRRLDSLTISLEQNHPKYYALKHRDKTLSIDQVQDNLNSTQAVLEYFEGENSIYAFSISKNKINTHTIAKDSLFSTTLHRFVAHFRKPSFDLEDDGFEDFRVTSHFLYQRLLQQAITEFGEEIEQITIIPPPTLSTIPWEVFIEDNEGNGYRDLNYLFKSYSISYGYSSSLLFQDVERLPAAQKKMLAIAPNYVLDGIADKSTNDQLAFRDELVPLKWNVPEVTSIGQFFDGVTLKGSEATEKNFKAQASNYQILHLAMHALVDHEKSMRSKLVFTYDNDSTEDGMLHTYELFNMTIPADLVVLSACNTGLGQIQKGEGVTSLARAFAYAGCPSVVMSHWSANDQTTSKLMTLFYENLAAGDNKDVALQKAKLSFLETANEVETNPLYWGSFVVMGDTSALQDNGNGLLLYSMIFGMVLIFILYLYKRPRAVT